MPSEQFDIYFSGQMMEGQDPALVRDRIRALFKASDGQMQLLFSGKPTAIKRGLDMESASRYRLAFRKAGALVEILPAKSGAGDQAMALLPANTGSLEEFAPRVPPLPLPDISAMELASPGTDLDPSAPPAPARLATGDLSLVAGDDWTLEDCQPPPLPMVVPDLEGLELTEPDSGGPLEPEREVRPPPAVPGLSMEDPDGGQDGPPRDG